MINVHVRKLVRDLPRVGTESRRVTNSHRKWPRVDLFDKEISKDLSIIIA